MAKTEHPFSWQALARIVAVGLILYLTWRLYDTILLIFVSLMMATAFYPIVLKLEQRRLSVTLSSILVVISLLLPIFIIIFTIVPGLVQQFPDIVRTVESSVNQSTLLPPTKKSTRTASTSR
jgi:predicted PurR-regulated permease PerM